MSEVKKTIPFVRQGGKFVASEDCHIINESHTLSDIARWLSEDGKGDLEELCLVIAPEFIDHLDTDRYQFESRTTAIYPEDQGMAYETIGLASEAGEVCNKIKKIIRDDGGEITDEKRSQIMGELGGTFWYMARLCDRFGFRMSDVMRHNLDQLLDRQKRGKLQGSGDDR